MKNIINKSFLSTVKDQHKKNFAEYLTSILPILSYDYNNQTLVISVLPENLILSIFVTTTKNLLIFLSEVMIALGILSLLFILEPTMFVFNFVITALGMALIGVVTRKKILKMGYESKRLRDDFFIKLNKILI